MVNYGLTVLIHYSLGQQVSEWAVLNRISLLWVSLNKLLTYMEVKYYLSVGQWSICDCWKTERQLNWLVVYICLHCICRCAADNTFNVFAKLLQKMWYLFVRADSSRKHNQMADRYNHMASADLLERIHQRRMEVQHTRQAIFWMTINFFAMFILCFDMWVNSQFLFWLFSWSSDMMLWFLSHHAALFVLNMNMLVELCYLLNNHLND